MTNNLLRNANTNLSIILLSTIKFRDRSDRERIAERITYDVALYSPNAREALEAIAYRPHEIKKLIDVMRGRGYATEDILRGLSGGFIAYRRGMDAEHMVDKFEQARQEFFEQIFS